MRDIVTLRYGSHLFGTATPASDIDLKSVFVPCARDILLGQVRPVVATSREKSIGEKTHAGETEMEAYSLQRYLGLLAEGQTVALDMLFAPASALLAEPAPEWREIVANADRLVSRKSAAFVGYCRQQASKYGVKGDRVASARVVADALDAWAAAAPRRKLGEHAADIAALVEGRPYTAIIDIPHPDGGNVRHLEVCGRKLPYTASVANGARIARRLVDEYGRRALQAERQQGVDWKAMSHAVRVASEAIELFSTGRITLPLPNAAHVLAIKTGQLNEATVAEEIDALLAALEEAAATSRLRDEPDRAWIDDFVASIHAKEIMPAGGVRPLSRRM